MKRDRSDIYINGQLGKNPDKRGAVDVVIPGLGGESSATFLASRGLRRTAIILGCLGILLGAAGIVTAVVLSYGRGGSIYYNAQDGTVNNASNNETVIRNITQLNNGDFALKSELAPIESMVSSNSQGLTNVVTNLNNNYYNKNDVYSKTEADGRFLPSTGGQVTGPISTTETSFQDNELVSKQYVTTAISNIAAVDLAPYLKSDGSVVATGLLSYSAGLVPLTDNQIVNKKYVDDLGNTFIKRKGDAGISGILAYTAEPGTPATTPTVPAYTDLSLVTKGYVDGLMSVNPNTLLRNGSITLTAPLSFEATPTATYTDLSLVHKKYIDDADDLNIKRIGDVAISGILAYAAEPGTPATTPTVPAYTDLSLVTKGYVDGLMSVNPNTLLRNGSITLTAPLSFEATPTATYTDLSLVHKKYIDDADDLNIKKTGDVAISGILAYAAEPGTPATTPTVPAYTDLSLVTKGYVDGLMSVNPNTLLRNGSITLTAPLSFEATPTATYTDLSLVHKKYIDDADDLNIKKTGELGVNGLLAYSVQPGDTGAVAPLIDIPAYTDLSLVTKKYVEDQNALDLKLTGGTVSGIIKGVDPVEDQDLATKKYVDAKVPNLLYVKQYQLPAGYTIPNPANPSQRTSISSGFVFSDGDPIIFAGLNDRVPQNSVLRQGRSYIKAFSIQATPFSSTGLSIVDGFRQRHASSIQKMTASETSATPATSFEVVSFDFNYQSTAVRISNAANEWDKFQSLQEYYFFYAVQSNANAPITRIVGFKGAIRMRYSGGTTDNFYFYLNISEERQLIYNTAPNPSILSSITWNDLNTTRNVNVNLLNSNVRLGRTFSNGLGVGREIGSSDTSTGGNVGSGFVDVPVTILEL